MEKNKPNTTKARIHQSKEMYYNLPFTTSGQEMEQGYSSMGRDK